MVVEGFIPFEEVLPFTDVFITTVAMCTMLVIEHRVSVLVAGVHEGKK
jgi:hypothetical protein